MQFIIRHPVLLTFLALTTVVIGLFVNTYLENEKQSAQGRFGGGTTVVVTAPAKMVTIVDEVEAIGTTRANESVSITSQVTDTVSKVNFEDGMSVQAGQILVELTNSEETAQLAEAQALVDEASRQFNRMQNLIVENLASVTELDAEKARMQTTNARLEAIIARLDDRLIRAPFDGVLGFRAISQGTLISPGTIITTLDDISIIKLDFSVPENYMAVLSVGQEVIATSPAYPEQTFLGRVQVISSRVDPITRSITIRAHLNNDNRLLRPGMLLTVHLVRSRSPALVIPEEAILPIKDKQFVYVVSENIAQRIEVKAGRKRPGIVEILSGLEEGQMVITQGVIKVRPGSKVTVKGENRSAGNP